MVGFKVDLDKNSQLFYWDFKTVCVEIRMSTKQKSNLSSNRTQASIKLKN